MSAAAGPLRRLQQLFRDIGINDDVQIAGHVGFLLIVRTLQPTDWAVLRSTRLYDLFAKLPVLHNELQRTYPGLEHIPPPPPERRLREGTLATIMDLLEEAIQVSPHNGSAGLFFQREIRYELLKNSTGSQYPTPFHLARLMASLVVPSSGSLSFPDVIDLAAGSGGLLAAAYEMMTSPESIECTGIDYDPAWSALGATNILLHDPSPGVTFRLGSAIGYRDSRGAPFTAVLLNPPFSGNRTVDEVGLLQEGDQYGTATVNVLCVKSLELLRPGGRAAMLIPSGVLFGSGANARLRGLFASHHLEAVITLDKECFQPYSHVPAHLIVIKKRAEDATPGKPVWLGMVMRDGYVTGAGRDLTREIDAATNELGRLQMLAKAAREDAWTSELPLNDGTVVEATSAVPHDGLPGASVCASIPLQPSRWQATLLTDAAIVAVNAMAGHTEGVFYLPLDGERATVFTRGEQQSWTEAMAESAPSGTPPIMWAGDREGVTVQVEGSGNRARLHLIIPKLSQLTGKKRSSCDTGYARLFDGTGKALTQWLCLDDAGVTQLGKEQFAKSSGAFGILDQDHQRCGWALELKRVENAEESGWLLLTTTPASSLFRNAASTRHLALLDGAGKSDSTDARREHDKQRGFLVIDREAGTARLVSGNRVVLPERNLLQGFAFGPAPADLDATYSLYGVLVPRSVLIDGAEVKTFEPKAYLPEPPAPIMEAPTQIAARMRRHQAELSERIDWLVNVLNGAGPGAPDTEADAVPAEILPYLGERQQQLWAYIKQYVSADAGNERFGLADLAKWLSNNNMAIEMDTLSQQLDLFVRAGMLVEISVGSRNLLRIVRSDDIVAGESVS